MRLLFVIDCLSSGGAQRQLVNLAVGLRARGHAVHLFTYHAEPRTLAPELEAAGVTIDVVRKWHRFSFEPVRYLRRLAGTGGFDAVVSFLETPNLYAELACLGADRPPLVVSVRNVLPAGRRGSVRRLLRQGARVADRVTTNAHHVRHALAEECPPLANRISTIWNGIDLERFRPGEPAPDGDALQLLALGSVLQRKKPLALVRALAAYRERFGAPVPRVTWAGRRGYSADSRATLRATNRLLAEAGLDNRWTWRGEVDDAPALLSEHDALVHPGAREGLPNSICEALAAGRPVLASRVLEHPRLVQDGVRGLLFDPDDPRETADAMHRLATAGRAEREQMGKAARAFAETHLSMGRYVEAYEALLAEIVGA